MNIFIIFIVYTRGKQIVTLIGPWNCIFWQIYCFHFTMIMIIFITKGVYKLLCCFLEINIFLQIWILKGWYLQNKKVFKTYILSGLYYIYINNTDRLTKLEIDALLLGKEKVWIGTLVTQHQGLNGTHDWGRKKRTEREKPSRWTRCDGNNPKMHGISIDRNHTVCWEF